MSLKYYARENKKHAKAKGIKLTKRQVINAIRKLFVAFHLDSVIIEFNEWGSGDYRRSWFSPYTARRAPQLAFGEGMLNLLTVAHEVAHYIRWVEKTKNKEKNFRWHDYKHARVVDLCLKTLMS